MAKRDVEGRERQKRRSLQSTGVEGVGVSESDDTVTLALDLDSMATETAPENTDYLLIFSSEHNQHRRHAVSDFLAFPAIGCSPAYMYTSAPLVPTLRDWVKPSGTQWIMLLGIGGGGGGGSGSVHATGSDRCGGGGGAGGAFICTPLMPASFFNAKGTVRVGVGGTGTPGAVGTTISGVTADGGFATSFEILANGYEINANAGGAGGGGTTTGGGGGNTSPMLQETIASWWYGRDAASANDLTPPTQPAPSAFGGGGGGAGGSSDTVGEALRQACGGGAPGAKVDTTSAPGTSRAPGAGAATSATPQTDIGWPRLTGAGGGGAGGGTQDPGFAAGDGVSGRFPGGGGGGGGFGTNGPGGHGGNGGSGADGLGVVYSFF